MTPTSLQAGVGTAFSYAQLSQISSAVNNLNSTCPAPDLSNPDSLTLGPNGCGDAVDAVTTSIDDATNCIIPSGTSPLNSDLSRLQGDVGGIASGPIPSNVGVDFDTLQADDDNALNQGGQPLSAPGC